MTTYASISWAIAAAVGLGGTLGMGTATAQEPTLTGTVWQLEQIRYNNDTTAIPDNPENYTIQFFEDGTVGIKADCNVGNGVYDVDSSDFITLQALTLAACGPDSIDDEYRQGLENAALYFFQNGDLYLDLFADAGTMQFVAATEMTTTADEDTDTPPTETTTEPVRGLW